MLSYSKLKKLMKKRIASATLTWQISGGNIDSFTCDPSAASNCVPCNLCTVLARNSWWRRQMASWDFSGNALSMNFWKFPRVKSWNKQMLHTALVNKTKHLARQHLLHDPLWYSNTILHQLHKTQINTRTAQSYKQGIRIAFFHCSESTNDKTHHNHKTNRQNMLPNPC